ncbi:MAG TPA: type II secretion system protein [Vicinamibacterales bacterium]|nr:type II secretion system protein [Vicinamibacterales bacterium]
MTRIRSDSGFSLVELTVATGVLLIVSAIVTNALMQMTHAQTTIWNRTEMHSGIRGATELLQQEVGQAGRITLPGKVTLAAAINPVLGASPAAQPNCDPATPLVGAAVIGLNTDVVGGNAVDGMWASAGPPASYISLTTLDGDKQETVRVAAINAGATPPTITACFLNDHAAGTVLVPLGGFATGIIPDTGIVNGSSGSVLKMYGDINGDGHMVYVEYTCDTTAHNLYRNVMPFDAMSKPPVTAAQILLSNIIDNPGGTPCFTYQRNTRVIQGTPFTLVTDVAITLTVQTQQQDPVTKQYQTETKALLNVSPRNVFNAWALASIGYTDRIQSTPATVRSLLP